MLRSGFSNQLSAIFNSYDINPNKFRDVCLTLVTADYILGSNNKSLDVDLFTSFGSDVEWDDVLAKLGVVNKGICSASLPDVQKVRVICDALLIETKGIVEGTSFTSEVSNKVGNTLGVNKHAGIYDTIDDCYRIFDCYSTETTKDYQDTFKYISDNLKIMSEIDKVVKHPIFSKYDFSNVYLDSKYSSYGFNVSRDIPNKLSAASSFEDFEYYIRTNFINEVLNSFIIHLTKGVMDSVDMVTLIRKLTTLKRVGSNVPIGIHCRLSEVNIISLPKFPNEVLNKYMSDIFSESIPLTESSLSAMYKCIGVLNSDVRSVIE